MNANDPRGRSVTEGDEDVQPIMLCRKDRRRFYNLLDADIPTRFRRMEIAVYGILAATFARLVGGVPLEQFPASLIQLIFG